MVDFTFKTAISFLGKRGAYFSKLPHLRVEIDIKMFGFQNFPIEIIVLYFIPAKIILSGKTGVENERSAE